MWIFEEVYGSGRNCINILIILKYEEFYNGDK